MALISALISLITLIVFFVMASNIGQINKKLDTKTAERDYIVAFNKGELKEYLGKKEEAMDCYMESYFLFSKFVKKNPNVTGIDKRREEITNKIKSIGGTVKEVPN